MAGAFDAGTLQAKLALDDKQFKTKIKESGEKVDSFTSKIANNAQKIKALGKGFTVAGGLITAGMTAGVLAANAFNKSIAEITTLTTPAITNVENLKEKIRDLAVIAAKDTEDIAGGAYEVASAFGEAALQGKILDINVRGAAAGMSTTKEAIKLTSAVTKAYGDTSEKAVQKVMDLSFQTVKLGQTTFPELAASIGRTTPLMVAMGGNVEELFASFATLTGVTGTASEVSSQFSGILGAMIKPTGEMSEAIIKAGKAHLGLENASAKTLIQEMGLVEAMKAVIGTTDGSMTSMGKLIARKEALTAVLALTGGQADVFSQKLAAMSVSGGAAEVAFNKVSKGVNAAGFSMEQAKVKFSIAMQRIGEAVMPIASALVSAFSSVVGKISDWIKKFPLLSKAIIGIVAIIGGLMLVIGPLLIALPMLAKGWIFLKGAMLMTSGVITSTLIPALMVLKANLIAIAGVGAAAFIGWQIGNLIRQIDGVDEATQGFWDTFLGISTKYEYRMAIMNNAVTDHAKHTRDLRNRMIETAQAIDANVVSQKQAAIVLKSNQEAYDALHPRIRRIVDGLTQWSAVGKALDKEEVIRLARTQEQTDAIAKIIEASNEKIKGLTRTLIDFKVAELDREYQANLAYMELSQGVDIERMELSRAYFDELKLMHTEMTNFDIAELERIYFADLAQMEKNNALNTEKLVLKRAFDLEIERITAESKARRDALRKKEFEIEKKQEETRKKLELEKIKLEQEQTTAHQSFLDGLKKQGQELILKQIQERDGWRMAELQRIGFWESEQLTIAKKRMDDDTINYFQYQEEINIIHAAAHIKRLQLEEENRKKTEEAERNMGQRLWSNFQSMTQQKQQQMGEYFSFLTNLNTVWAAIRETSLNNWYDAEYARIISSQMSHEQKEAAIEALDTKMHQKKAALDAAAAKREKALAIAQAIANTAVAITTALKALPWPFNLPAIAFAIAMGAAQIAAIGGAYKGPNIGDFEGGTGGDTGGGGGGGDDYAGGGKKYFETYQHGTRGWVDAMPEFIAGDPGSPERVQLGGNLAGVKMNITPLRDSIPTGETRTFNIVFNVSPIDASDFQEKLQREAVPVIEEAIQNGLIPIPRGRIVNV